LLADPAPIPYERLRADAEDIFRAAVRRADPRALLRAALRVGPRRLRVRASGQEGSWDLREFRRILVLGFGKASAGMAEVAEELLGERISEGLVAANSGPARPLRRVRVVVTAHPLPDARSEQAAREMLALARRADERTLVLVLASGGGSALAAVPWEGGGRALSLEDKRGVTRELLACGADIREINAVRRHLSAFKGGRLAEALSGAAVLTLVLSDVVGDELSSIASGPTVPDPTTWADALGVIERYRLAERIAPAALAALRDGAAGRLPDTPKPGDPVFRRVRCFLVGSNREAALAARRRARQLGYRACYLGSRFTGEARELARAWLGLGLDCAAHGTPVSAPACLLGGGESTVTLRGGGRGGRNQEAALPFLLGLSRAEEALARRLVFLAAGTDGNDGPTDAAGAFADLQLLERARAAALDLRAHLEDNDSHGFFQAVDGLLRTGPTGTNVCDLWLLCVAPP
jgi:hydroxypyruvate reductase